MAGNDTKPTDILQAVIKRQYLDNGNYDVFISLGDYDAGPGELVVESISGASTFLIQNGEMRTPEITITAYVTKAQDTLLRQLYVDTVHPLYIDERHPVTVRFGDTSTQPFMSFDTLEQGCVDDAGQVSGEFYLAEYTPPTQVTFNQASLLPVSITLRLI